MPWNSVTNAPDYTVFLPTGPHGLNSTEFSSILPFISSLDARYRSSQSSLECHLILIPLVLLTPLVAFFPPFFLFEKYSLFMQEGSLSFHEQISDKCRKLEWSVECQRQGRKWIGIGRVAAARIAADVCRQLRAIHLHLWGIRAPRNKASFHLFHSQEWTVNLHAWTRHWLQITLGNLMSMITCLGCEIDPWCSYLNEKWLIFSVFPMLQPEYVIILHQP